MRRTKGQEELVLNRGYIDSGMLRWELKALCYESSPKNIQKTPKILACSKVVGISDSAHNAGLLQEGT
jgi:hypothetical protein